MKKYVVNIGSITNCISDPDFFIGTGFRGADFDTYKELKELIKEYAVGKDNRWKSTYIKFSFSLGTTLETFITEGNRQCRENGEVNLITAALACRKDPFRNIKIVYCPQKWVDNEGKTFKFLITKDGKNYEPFYGQKLIDALHRIGMEL